MPKAHTHNVAAAFALRRLAASAAPAVAAASAYPRPDVGSELAFRLLARRHGAQLCYTPMIRSEEFSVPLLERHADDCPLVAHFSGNDPQTLLDAARQAERCRGVVAVDLNLGCPQRAARSGRFGAFLCDAYREAVPGAKPVGSTSVSYNLVSEGNRSHLFLHKEYTFLE